jgi:hypothetical protein
MSKVSVRVHVDPDNAITYTPARMTPQTPPTDRHEAEREAAIDTLADALVADYLMRKAARRSE